MFVHINPEVGAFGETISTLKFAERVSLIELGAARVNKESGQVKELKEEVVFLHSSHLVKISFSFFVLIYSDAISKLSRSLD